VLCLSFGAGACLLNVNCTKESIFIFAQRSSRNCRFVKPFALFSLQCDSTFLFFSGNESVYTDNAVADYSVL